MEGMQNLFDYFESFLYANEKSEFGDNWNYPILKNGQIRFKFYCSFKNGEEFERECLLDLKTSEDGWIYLDKYYKFMYNYGLVREIVTLTEEATIRLILVLLNLQTPVIVGNFCKEEKIKNSDKIRTLLFNIENDLGKDKIIESQRTISYDSDILKQLLVKYIISEDDSLESLDGRVDDEEFIATFSIEYV